MSMSTQKVKPDPGALERQRRHLPRRKENTIKKTILALLLAAIALGAAPTALAHTQTVAPPGQDAPVINNDPIARPFAQAHCQAQAPEAVANAPAAASFSPATELPCPSVENPGGQVTGP